jgi:sugar phosphate isomerase/epimerase
MSLLNLPTARSMPEVYRWLAALPDDPPLLEIPVPARDEDENEDHALRQYLILFHGKPRIGGISAFISRRYREFRSEIQEFPSRTSLNAASQMGARLIIVHYGDYPEPSRVSLRRRIADEPLLTPRGAFGEDVVYELQSIGQSE